MWCRTSSQQGILSLHGRHFVEREDEQDTAVSLAELEEYLSVQIWALGGASTSLQLQSRFPIAS